MQAFDNFMILLSIVVSKYLHIETCYLIMNYFSHHCPFILQIEHYADVFEMMLVDKLFYLQFNFRIVKGQHKTYAA